MQQLINSELTVKSPRRHESDGLNSVDFKDEINKDFNLEEYKGNPKLDKQQTENFDSKAQQAQADRNQSLGAKPLPTTNTDSPKEKK